MSMQRFSLCATALAVSLLPALWAGTAAAQTIANWKFDQDNFLTDSSGNGYTLQNIGATAAAEDYDGSDTASNGSAYFNGTTDWMTTIEKLDLSAYEVIRISWWAKDEGAGGTVLGQSANFNSTAGAMCVGCGTYNGNSETGLNTGNGNNADCFAHEQGVWEQCAVEYRIHETDPAKVVQVWRNGVLQEDVTAWGNRATAYANHFANDKFYIGQSAGVKTPFLGNIDELKIEDLNGGSTLANWQFEAGSNFLSDSSGNGHDLINQGVGVLSVTEDYDGTGTASQGSAYFDGASGLETVDNLDLSPYRHIRVSWWMKNEKTGQGWGDGDGSGCVGIYALTADCNANDGAITASVNELTEGVGCAQVTWNGSYGGNDERLPNSIDGTWEEYAVEYNLDATDAANVVIVTRNGEVLGDSTVWGKKQVASVSFANDYFYFGSLGGNPSFFQGYLDEILVEVARDLHPGDANGDDKVNEEDAAVLAEHWLQQGYASWANGDFNSDGKVDDLDATILAANWNYGVGDGSESVPEPSVLMLLVCGLMFLAAAKRSGLC